MTSLLKETMQARRRTGPRTVLSGLLVSAMVFFMGCASAYTTIAPRQPERFEKLGRAEGTACGTMFIDGTAYNFIPILLNERTERAYGRAVESVPGATALANVSMQEYWFWWVLGTTRCVTIKGEAIR